MEEKQDVKAYRPWKRKPIICTDCATDEERKSEDFEPLKMRELRILHLVCSCERCGKKIFKAKFS